MASGGAQRGMKPARGPREEEEAGGREEEAGGRKEETGVRVQCLILTVAGGTLDGSIHILFLQRVTSNGSTR